MDELVAECAKRLDVTKPRIVVRNDPYPRSYLVMVGEVPHLVLTSSLLQLFEKQPDQFRFIVGRELGHLKCDHLRLRRVSFGLLTLLRAIDIGAVPEKAQGLLPTYAVGRWLTWSRESEISADRAGLICCGQPDSAYEALLTLLHGLKADSVWRDPRHPTFDADRIVREFRNWEKEPLIVGLRYLHEQPAEAPFLVERLAALKQYVDSGQYQALLDRVVVDGSKLMVTLQGIDLLGLAPTGSSVCPYFKCFDSDQLLITSDTASRGSLAYFQQFRTVIKLEAGTPLFFEVWDDGIAYDTLLGGFVLYPNLPAGKAHPLGLATEQDVSSPIHWDWKDRSLRKDAGVVHARLRLIPVK
ncbi:MAG TPA: M48 family metallopeptidase [Planctomycetaceae bacterium]|nr:M48 family metallopeptidase [Planctomycetaceae bacterium]